MKKEQYAKIVELTSLLRKAQSACYKLEKEFPEEKEAFENVYSKLNYCVCSLHRFDDLNIEEANA